MNEFEADTISTDDARAMIRLLAGTAALDCGHAEKKQHLMDEFCDLIDADAWGWALCYQEDPSAQPVYTSALYGGFTKERYSKLLQAVEHPAMREVAGPFFMKAAMNSTALTMQRKDIDEIGPGLHKDVEKYWDEADVGPILLSYHPLDLASASFIAIYRQKGRAHFSKSEVKMAEIILSEVSWLHHSGWPEDKGATVPRLSPRQRTVLNLLLDGWSRKQIAANLDLSIHTVSGYAKQVYRHFGVNSHPELMRRFSGTYE